MACLLRGPHHLRDETLRPGRPAPAIANAAGPDPQVVIAPPHGLPWAMMRATALGSLKSLLFVRQAPARRRGRLPKTSIPPTTCARPRSALLSCRPWIGDSRRPHLSGMSADLAGRALLARCRIIATALHSFCSRTAHRAVTAMRTRRQRTGRLKRDPMAQAATNRPAGHVDHAQ
jgi:hypothetical protein